MTEPEAGWPLTHEQRELVVFLGGLIRRGGAERFTSAHLAGADRRDFPGVWKPTLHAVHALLYRLCWHAHLDPEIVVEDRRPRVPPTHQMLTSSVIELGDADAARATFHVESIGNDDVCGLLAHQIGAVFLHIAPPDPFREAKREATPAEESAAAVYLGLGVLVANSAMYRRHASRVVGREVVSESVVAKVGGLSIGDATLLLAVQDAVRDDHQAALSTLHPPQAEWVRRWADELEPHEDELRALLELDGREPVPLSRRDQPRDPPPLAERDLRKFNDGRTTFRVPRSLHGRMLLGFTVGLAGFALPHGLILGTAFALTGGLGGLKLAKRAFECSDPECRARMAAEVPICPGCGGSIADTIKHANMRLDRLEELEGSADAPIEE